MNFLDAIEKVSEFVEAPNDFRNERCLRTLNRGNECEICIQNCPLDAIRFDETIIVNHEQCIHCGLCLRLCPVGALVGDDGVSKLIRCFQFLENVNSIELVCNQNPQAKFGPAGEHHVIQSDRCLASYGPSVFLLLHAIGVNHIAVRLDACATCSLKALKEQAAKSAAAAEHLLSLIERPKMSINVLDEFDLNWVERLLIDMNNPPLNRRSFLGLFSKQSMNLISKLVEISGENSRSDKRPSRERLRVIKSIQLLCENSPEIPFSQIVEALNLVSLTVDERCSACGVCADVCPTGALEFRVDEHKNYELRFLPAYCADCGVCVDCCERGAVYLERIVLPDQNWTKNNLKDQILIKNGQLKRCDRCHVYYSSSTNTGLCPICEQRRANPFGFVIPKKFQTQS